MAEMMYVGMTDEARRALITISVLWVAFAVVVFFRWLGRIRGAGIGADDILSLVALVLSSPTIGMSAAVFVAGVGIDFDDSLPEYPRLVVNMPFIMQITFAFTLIYLWTLACLKLSQLCLYNRVFHLHLRYWIWTGTSLVIIWAVAFTFSFIFLCSPIKQQWSLERLGHCIDQITVLKSLIATNIVTDVFIFILPIRSVWKLQMRKTEKIAVISCFALGAACVIIGIVRFWQIYVINLIGNLTGTSLTTFMLCSIELMLAGLCVNIPMLRPFYLRWRTKHKMSQGGSQAFNQGTGGFKSIRSDPLAENQPAHGPAKHTAWIELDDKEHDSLNDDDSGSQRKLTCDQPSAIHVSKNWSVASTHAL
ncbi:hypothetical protein Q7P36_008631 [Cladosporium allicinum]